MGLSTKILLALLFPAGVSYP